MASTQWDPDGKPIDEVIQRFNSLEKPKMIHYLDDTLESHPNHWHISIRRNHIFFFVLLGSPAPFRDCVTILEDQEYESIEGAEFMALHIICMFLHRSPPLDIRPWIWSTNDGLMGHTVIAVMREWGVDESLLGMPAACKEDNDLSNEAWQEVLRTHPDWIVRPSPNHALGPRLV